MMSVTPLAQKLVVSTLRIMLYFASIAMIMMPHELPVSCRCPPIHPQDGNTPLHRAAYFGKTACATMLMEAGACRDIKNKVSPFTSISTALDSRISGSVPPLARNPPASSSNP